MIDILTPLFLLRPFHPSHTEEEKVDKEKLSQPECPALESGL